MAKYVQEYDIAEFDGTLKSMSCFPEEDRNRFSISNDGDLLYEIDLRTKMLIHPHDLFARDSTGCHFSMMRDSIKTGGYIPKEVYIRQAMVEEGAEHQAEVAKEVEEDLADREMRMEFEQEYNEVCEPFMKQQEFISDPFVKVCFLNRERILKLVEYGALSDNVDAVRDHNVGKSDYSEHTQTPWSIWAEYGLDPWDADIIKRVLREKDGDPRELDYQKIIHICQEKLRQLKNK